MSGSALASLSQEELAAHLWQRRTVSSGVAFVRNVERPSKDAARLEVLQAFSPAFFPNGLSVLTMPSLRWTFERALLQKREAGRLRKHRRAKRTYICAIESDEAIFRASFKFMPGADGHTEGKGIAVLPALACATTTVRTPLVQRYHRCTFEDYAECCTAPYEVAHRFDAAWLDFNGPLTERRLAAIRTFWTDKIRSLLVVTALNARTTPEISALIQSSGAPSRLLQDVLIGSRVVRSITYHDTAPMFQTTLVRPTNP